MTDGRRGNGRRMEVEVVTSLSGTYNDGDFCKYCILDALYELDDRSYNRNV